jgi:hypothetical protein
MLRIHDYHSWIVVAILVGIHDFWEWVVGAILVEIYEFHGWVGENGLGEMVDSTQGMYLDWDVGLYFPIDHV